MDYVVDVPGFTQMVIIVVLYVPVYHSLHGCGTTTSLHVDLYVQQILAINTSGNIHVPVLIDLLIMMVYYTKLGEMHKN